MKIQFINLTILLIVFIFLFISNKRLEAIPQDIIEIINTYKIVAKNGDANQPFIKFDDALNIWVVANNGSNEYEILATTSNPVVNVNIDSNTFVIDVTNDLVIIGAASPTFTDSYFIIESSESNLQQRIYNLDGTGTSSYSAGMSGTSGQFVAHGSSYAIAHRADRVAILSNSNAAGIDIVADGTGDTIRFYTDAYNTESNRQMTIEASGVEILNDLIVDGTTLIVDSTNNVVVPSSIQITSDGSVQPTLDRNSGTGGLIIDTTGTISGTNAVLDIADNGTSHFQVLGSGNTYVINSLGIGTSSPSQQLEIYHASNPVFSLWKNDATQRDYLIQISGDNLLIGESGGADLILDENGNVGIGTTSPSSLLQVGNPSVSDTPEIIVAGQGASSTFAGLSLYEGATSGASSYGFRHIYDSQNNTYEFKRRFSGSDNDVFTIALVNYDFNYDNNTFYIDTSEDEVCINGTTASYSFAAFQVNGTGTKHSIAMADLDSTGDNAIGHLAWGYESGGSFTRLGYVGDASTSDSKTYLVSEATVGEGISLNTGGLNRLDIDDPGNITINEDGNDCDFKIESLLDALTIFIEGSSGDILFDTDTMLIDHSATRVIIGSDINDDSGNGAPQLLVRNVDNGHSILKIRSVGGGPALFLESTNGTEGAYTATVDTEQIGSIIFNGQFDTSLASSANSTIIRCIAEQNFAANDYQSRIEYYQYVDSLNAFKVLFQTSANGVIINEDSVDLDFRVESDTGTNALFVQGSDGKIGFNTGTFMTDSDIELEGTSTVAFGIDGATDDSNRSFVFGRGNIAESSIDCRVSSTAASRYMLFNVGAGAHKMTLEASVLRDSTIYGNNISSGTRNVVIQSDGELGYNTSVLASKTNILTMESSNTEFIYNLRPITYNARKKIGKGASTIWSTIEAYSELRYGLIAEEVDEVNSDFVYDNGLTGEARELQGVDYKELIPVLLRAIQLLNDRITTLENP